MPKVAIFFPGQGAQHVGMGRRLAESFPAARSLYDRAAQILGYDLASLCFNGPAEELDSTVISQPALFGASSSFALPLAIANISASGACT